MLIALMHKKISFQIRVKHALYLTAVLGFSSACGVLIGAGYVATTIIPHEVSRIAAQTMANRILLETAIHDSRQCVSLANAMQGR